MTNAEIITALRCCGSLDTPCKGLCSYHGVEYCLSKKDLDAANALEAADKRIAELERILKAVQENSGINFRVWQEAEAQLPKEGEWIEDEYGYIHCSRCEMEWDEPEHPQTNYCPNCGCAMGGEKK